MCSRHLWLPVLGDRKISLIWRGKFVPHSVYGHMSVYKGLSDKYNVWISTLYIKLSCQTLSKVWVTSNKTAE